MNTEAFYFIINNDDELIMMLINWGIVAKPEDVKCEACLAEVRIRVKKRKNGTTWFYRCIVCKKERSVLGDTFFSFTTNGRLKANLPIVKMLKLIFHYFEGKTIDQLIIDTGINSRTTIVNWTNFIRERISEYLDQCSQIGGPGIIVEIDESLIRGKRKYNRGRLLIGDLLNSAPDQNSRRSNFGTRIDGPWAFGMIEKGTKKSRLFYVENRSRATLLPILLRNVHPESTIHSDQWAAYGTLGEHFHLHQTVNHKENFVDPDTGANTQLIECLWRQAKAMILSKKRGTPIELLQSHLDLFSFVYEHETGSFIKFMEILRNIQ